MATPRRPIVSRAPVPAVAASAAAASARRIDKLTYVATYAGYTTGSRGPILLDPTREGVAVPATRRAALLRAITPGPSIIQAARHAAKGAKDLTPAFNALTGLRDAHDGPTRLQAARELSGVAPADIRAAFGEVTSAMESRTGALVEALKADYAQQHSLAADQVDIGAATEWGDTTAHPTIQALRDIASGATGAVVGAASGTRALLDSVRAWSSAAAAALEQAYGPVSGIVPISVAYLERLEFIPAGVQRGEFLHSIPLAPGEVVSVTHKVWATTTTEYENIVTDSFEDYSEKGVAEKSELSQATESESKHSVNRSVGLQTDAKFEIVTVSAKGDLKVDDESSSGVKDSVKHSMELTRKASSRAKKDRKVSFKVTTVQGNSTETGQQITNYDQANPIRVDYFELLKKWRVRLIRYGARQVYDLVIPSPASELLANPVEYAALARELARPFRFPHTPQDITDNAWEALGAQYAAAVAPPPEPYLFVATSKGINPSENDAGFDSFDIPVNVDGYELDGTVPIDGFAAHPDHSHIDVLGDTSDADKDHWFRLVGGGGFQGLDGVIDLRFLDGAVPSGGKINVPYAYLGFISGAISIRARLRRQASSYAQWQMTTWGALRDAAQTAYTARQAALAANMESLRPSMGSTDPLTLRQIEREAITKAVLSWMLGPDFGFLPADIDNNNYFAVPDAVRAATATDGSQDQPANDPQDQTTDDYGGAYVLDPSGLDPSVWVRTLAFGDVIRFLHEALEWENMLSMPYAYFWDTKKNWAFKRSYDDADYLHRAFLRSGSLRVVLPIRPGFQHAFLAFMEQADPNGLVSAPAYRQIADDIAAQDAALGELARDQSGAIIDPGRVLAEWDEYTPSNALDIAVVRPAAEDGA